MQDIRAGCFGGVFVPEWLCGFTKAWGVCQSALVSSVSLQDEWGDCWNTEVPLHRLSCYCVPMQRTRRLYLKVLLRISNWVFKLLSLVFIKSSQMKSTVALGWIFPYSPKSTVSLICMRNLAICGVLCMACVSSASCAVTCLVCRMVEVGRGVWKILVFQKDYILPAYTEMLMLNFLHR